MSQRNFELLKEGHASALADIYAKYNRRIFWFGKGLLNDDFVINSLVQDTFLKLWMHRDTIQSPEHIFYFLRFVMKRECISYYSRPRNKFFRKTNSIETFKNYQDYMLGYDPTKDSRNLLDQQEQQKEFERVKSVLPFLNSEKRHLINLCLKHGFRYKAIAQVMGLSIGETSLEVKKAIQDIKTIIHQESILKTESKPIIKSSIQKEMTEEQETVLELRCVKKCSFADIATELGLSRKEVHKAFTAAYKLMQEKHQQQTSAEHEEVYA